MCAYQLRRRGCLVTLLDKDLPGGPCSAGNAGWITPSMAGPLPAPGVVGTSVRWMLRGDSPLYIRPLAAPALAGWLWRFWRHCNARDYQAGLEAIAGFNRRTMSLFDGLVADGLAFEMHEQGLLYAFLSRRALAHAVETIERIHALGYPGPQPLTMEQVHEMEPALGGAVIGGVMVAGERHVRPETLMAALCDRLSHDPGVTLLRAGAAGFVRRKTRIAAVRTRDDQLEGDQFLLAAGAWSGALGRALGVSLPVQAGRGYSVTVEQPAVRLRQPLYLDEAKVACSPFDGALRMAGTMEFSGLHHGFDERRVRAIGRSGDSYLPGWRQGSRTAAWSGMRPVAPDGLPVIGGLPGLENAFVATGHAMLGITLAPATATAVAELMCTGRAATDLAAFDPRRFARLTA